MNGWYKLLAAIAVSVGIAYFTTDRISAENVPPFIDNSISISATLLGFLLALVAIMVTLSDHRLVRRMKQTGHLADLYGRYFLAVLGFFAAVVLGLVIRAGGMTSNVYVVGAFLFVFVFGLVTAANATWYFYNIVLVISGRKNDGGSATE